MAITGIGILAASALTAAAGAQTQQSPVKDVGIQTQIEIAGSGLSTLDIGRGGLFGGRGLGSRSQINFADSSLSLGAAQRLYRGGIGSFTFGGLTIDESNVGHGKQFFMHQAFADFQELRYEAYLGRTNSPAAQIVAFPTIREDDLVDFTSVLDPFSDGANAEEHRYSNVAALVINRGLRQFLNVHAQHQIDSAGVGEGDTGLNSFGLSYQYEGNPALKTIERVPSFGAGFEHRAVKQSAGGASDVIYAGGILNLQPGLVNKLDLRFLGQATFGNDTAALSSLNDTYRADQQAIALSLRKLYSPFGHPASQWALTAGAKRYSKISDANSCGVALSYAKSLGQGFDFISQVGYEHRSEVMANAFEGRRDSAVFQIGLAFNFGSTFNQSVGPRRSPTNLLHQYIPN
ncbi:MAG: hypothetical protein HYR64_04995 [Fimbriimonas ginsengisoli]|uniref:Porin n=1 Tax=Fimbriimonas ginsengisoli TaxID=1005039 RepID=A0A931PTH5_FIMGI|nr:hypothetical protein [Fimbriimonas ginsengisoli]